MHGSHKRREFVEAAFWPLSSAQHSSPLLSSRELFELETGLETRAEPVCQRSKRGEAVSDSSRLRVTPMPRGCIASESLTCHADASPPTGIVAIASRANGRCVSGHLLDADASCIGLQCLDLNCTTPQCCTFKQRVICSVRPI